MMHPARQAYVEEAAEVRKSFLIPRTESGSCNRAVCSTLVVKKPKLEAS
jgi:hypothetical protein